MAPPAMNGKTEKRHWYHSKMAGNLANLRLTTLGNSTMTIPTSNHCVTTFARQPSNLNINPDCNSLHDVVSSAINLLCILRFTTLGNPTMEIPTVIHCLTSSVFKPYNFNGNPDYESLHSVFISATKRLVNLILTTLSKFKMSIKSKTYETAMVTTSKRKPDPIGENFNPDCD